MYGVAAATDRACGGVSRHVRNTKLLLLLLLLCAASLVHYRKLLLLLRLGLVPAVRLLLARRLHHLPVVMHRDAPEMLLHHVLLRLRLLHLTLLQVHVPAALRSHHRLLRHHPLANSTGCNLGGRERAI